MTDKILVEESILVLIIYEFDGLTILSILELRAQLMSEKYFP